jgi:hypothetical protein
MALKYTLLALRGSSSKLESWQPLLLRLRRGAKNVNKVDRREMRPLLALGVHLTEHPKEKRINIFYNKKLIQ